MTVIEITPHPWGGKAFEAPGVETVFPKKIRQSITRRPVFGFFDLQQLIRFPKLSPQF
jgi:hypothetical protein